MSGPAHDGTVRVLVSKIGLDGHDRGAKLVAEALREAGMEVSYLGIRHTLEQVVDTAVCTRVHYLGLSFLAGDHMTWVRKVLRALRERGAGKTRLVVGGIIPRDEAEALREMGVEEVFLPGTPLGEIVSYFQTHATTGAGPGEEQ